MQTRFALLPLIVAAAAALTPTAMAGSMALKDLMKRMGAQQTAGDAKAMAPLFAQTRTMKPADPDFAGWDAIADKGKAAADKGDLDATKATCKECHGQYRDKFKTRYGSKAP
jgi:hypothetical protein